MQPKRDLTSSEGTSGARAVESGEANQLRERFNNFTHEHEKDLQNMKISKEEINKIKREYTADFSKHIERSIEDAEKFIKTLENSLKLSVERRKEKAPISASQSDMRFSEEMKKDLKIDFFTTGYNEERINIPSDVSQTSREINNELNSIKSTLLKADNLSSDLKLDILSGIQHRREQIETNYRQALLVDGRGKGNYDQAAKRLKGDLKYLESIKKYVQEGEPLVGSKTEGLEPHINRDSYFTNDKLRIFGVFDGVGRNEGSDIASKSASKFIKSHLEKTISDDIDSKITKDMMRDVLKQANDGLYRQKQRDPAYSKMGTTASVAKIMKDGTVVIGNVGDCRALLIKRKSQDVEHLTLDNSQYNTMHLIHEMNTRDELLEYQKQIAQIKDFNQTEDSKLKPIIRCRNTISSCLGMKDGFHVDMYEHKMERGDILILASDGITDNLTDQEIHKIIRKNKWNPEKATEDLVQRAKKISEQVRPEGVEIWEFRSKPDDMTVVIATY